ncbi:MAG: putative secondary metabolism biosynthetic enzyme [Chrysothrix sp. TS-e1954]|nr:MAG: putative secondary metabolism biosynthetic enzyme [Chrysothrix sp. TS-e1954]
MANAIVEPEAEKQSPDTFHGWMARDATSSMSYQAFKPKVWEETDVDIRISHCGVCASDLHTLRSGWGQTTYPCCVGHEIVGTAVRVGKNARQGISIGDRVGVGPQGYTCNQPDCGWCSSGRENYCPHRVGTYGDRYPNGSISYGGFADYCRHNSASVFSIPDGLSSADAAVMLCAGSTIYEPLKEHGAGPEKRVGVIGLGGLGHLAVLFAKAMGSRRVVVFSRREEKRVDALELGADEYVATAEDDKWSERHAASLDLIICTVSGPKMPLLEYLTLLRPKGHFCQVGIPEEPLPPLDAMALVLNGTSIAFSDSASPTNIRAMLESAAKNGIKAWTESRPMGAANEVVQDMEKGKARFRFVLENQSVL